MAPGSSSGTEATRDASVDMVETTEASGLVCTVLAHEGCFHVTLCGEIDIATAERLMEVLDRCLAGPACRSLTVDLSNVPFLDASGLRVLVRARRRLADDRRVLTLTHLQPMARRVIALTGLTDYLGVMQDG